MKHRLAFRSLLLISLMITVVGLSTRLQADTGSCNGATTTLPFTDVMASPFFCQIAAAYFSGLTNGTTATTYSPGNVLTREQMAAFTTRTLDQSVKRGHARAALGQWWTNGEPRSMLLAFTGGHNPRFLACDGLTVWISNTESNNVSRHDIRTGQLICTLTGVPSPQQLVIVSGNVYVASHQSPGKIYRASIQNTTNGPMSEFVTNLGNNTAGITYDGFNLWMANVGTAPGNGSISRVNFFNTQPTTFTTGFVQPVGVLFDGVNLWVTDGGDPALNNASLKRVNPNTGAVLQTIPLSGQAGQGVFDGTNLWIPCAAIPQFSVPDKVFVVRATGGPPLLGTILAELTGNGLDGAFTAAFDGERICVTNASGQSVSLWKASDLSPLGAFLITIFGTENPRGVCSDGITFFVGIRHQSGSTGYITRF